MIVFKCEGCGDTSEIINVLCGCGLIQKPTLTTETDTGAEVTLDFGVMPEVKIDYSIDGHPITVDGKVFDKRDIVKFMQDAIKLADRCRKL